MIDDKIKEAWNWLWEQEEIPYNHVQIARDAYVHAEARARMAEFLIFHHIDDNDCCLGCDLVNDQDEHHTWHPDRWRAEVEAELSK